MGVGGEECRQAVERDELDYCSAPFAQGAYRELAGRYGINKGRFFFNPTLETDYFAFNHDRPAFKGAAQIPLKQAINWAIDRPALARAAGFLATRRTDQILPPAMARDEKIYPLVAVNGQNLARARALLAKARFKPAKLVVYAPNGSYQPAWAQILRFNLKRLGIDVEIKYFSIEAFFEKTGTRGEPFDMAWGGWVANYPDPVDFFSNLLNGTTITPTGNTNIAYFDRPQVNREIARISRLTGEARDEAWADLDVDLMRTDPPWAPVANLARLDFVSASFGCYVFQPVLARFDLAAACKK
jgi:peptide/nickel transport system substrate-binding protein